MTIRPHVLLISRLVGSLVVIVLLQPGLGLEAGDLEPSLELFGNQEPETSYLRYGSKGLQFTSADQQTDLWLGLRFQSRTDTLPGQIRSASDLQPPPNGATEIRRARIKGGGTIFTENFEIYSEYDIPSDTLLDYRGTWHLSEQISIRAGQWKSDFNRERIDSSGKQQFVDRSLANYWFTLDRQLGTSLQLRLEEGQSFDSSVWLEYLTGQGLGAGYRDDNGLWMLRWQWNPQGEVLGFGQADLDRTEPLVSGVTLGAVSGDSDFTRFSSSGGGQLPGYSSGNFRLNQLMFETAAKWRGCSWQHELHWKDIENLSTGTHQSVFGGYAQVGTFPSEYLSYSPEPLELVTRLAHVKPDVSRSSNDQWEWMLGANWYINGHRNKISADASVLDIDDPEGGESEFRFRLQWEISF